jgi:hypothetical protein
VQQVRAAMTLNQWQRSFLNRLIELGGSISVPTGVVTDDLIALIEANYVREGSGGTSQTRYEITKAGRACSQK